MTCVPTCGLPYFRYCKPLKLYLVLIIVRITGREKRWDMHGEDSTLHVQFPNVWKNDRGYIFKIFQSICQNKTWKKKAYVIDQSPQQTRRVLKEINELQGPLHFDLSISLPSLELEFICFIKTIRDNMIVCQISKSTTQKSYIMCSTAFQWADQVLQYIYRCIFAPPDFKPRFTSTINGNKSHALLLLSTIKPWWGFKASLVRHQTVAQTGVRKENVERGHSKR